MKKNAFLLLCLLSTSVIAQKFSKNTYVTLKDGTEVRVDSLLQGDSILAIHISKQQIEPICVKKITKTVENESVSIHLADSTNLTVSTDSRVLGNHGWLTKEGLSEQKDKKDKKLKNNKYEIDDFVVCFNQYLQLQSIPITEIKIENNPLEMYSIDFESSSAEDVAFPANNIFISH